MTIPNKSVNFQFLTDRPEIASIDTQFWSFTIGGCRFPDARRPVKANGTQEMVATRRIFIAAIALVVAAVTASPASAQIVDGSRYTDSREPTPPTTFPACGVTVQCHILAITWSGAACLKISSARNPVQGLSRSTTSRIPRPVHESGNPQVLAGADDRAPTSDVKIDLVSGTVYRFTWPARTPRGRSPAGQPLQRKRSTRLRFHSDQRVAALTCLRRTASALGEQVADTPRQPRSAM